MGSFRLVAGNWLLHQYNNFAGWAVETVPKSLRHSCGSELTRQGISLPEDRYSYGRRLLGLQFNASALTSHLLLTFQHRAGVTLYTSPCGFAESCVLVKQSLGPLHCGSFEHSFSRTYGVILPSSLATVLSLTSGYSPCPPVSVLVRAGCTLLEAFPGSRSACLRYSIALSLPYHAFTFR